MVRSETDMAAGVEKLGGFEAGLYAEAWVPFVKVQLPSHQPEFRPGVFGVACMVSGAAGTHPPGSQCML